ncbi:hypothetical protein F2P81_009076 [Scophthalmus maximus]|uniref:Uncharacterized protein n=1 Tax=Scophthalmus maximus TaxID=52904 RepID=A0A6A4T8V6_SCOMX|nr:hypothetical protein F2P81_009076 [Scophthalmus maximus]
MSECGLVQLFEDTHCTQVPVRKLFPLAVSQSALSPRCPVRAELHQSPGLYLDRGNIRICGSPRIFTTVKSNIRGLACRLEDVVLWAVGPDLPTQRRWLAIKVVTGIDGPRAMNTPYLFLWCRALFPHKKE